jgi:hypothetical protein
MFPLSGKDYPKSAEELRSAINDSLADVFALPREEAAVSVLDGGAKYPAIKVLKVDLDDAAVSAGKPPPKPLGAGKRKPGPQVQKLELSARPIRYEKAKLHLQLNASDVKFDFDRDKRGRPLLVLRDARQGKVDIRISKTDLKTLLAEVASVAAQRQGVTVQDMDVALEPAGPRSIAADVRVQARKLLLRGVVNVRGQLDLDEQFNATLSGLTCTGEGVIGSAAAGFIQQKIREFEGWTISLMAFSLGDVSLRDLKIDVRKDVHVTAAFGAKAVRRQQTKARDTAARSSV